MPGNFPITKLKFNIFKASRQICGYEPAVINEDIFKDICELEETYLNNSINAPEYKYKKSENATKKPSKKAPVVLNETDDIVMI